MSERMAANLPGEDVRHQCRYPMRAAFSEGCDGNVTTNDTDFGIGYSCPALSTLGDNSLPNMEKPDIGLSHIYTFPQKSLYSTRKVPSRTPELARAKP
jgi:hypothetical protein